MKKENFIVAFDNSLMKDNLIDCGVDFMEATIDNIIDNSLIDTFPIVKLIKSAYNGIKTIHERHLIKQTMIFLQELKKQNCNNITIKEYREKINISEKRFNQELERVLIILDKQTEATKAIYLARLFSALINEQITLQEFNDYTELLDGMLVFDLKIILNDWSKIKNGLILVKQENIRYFKRISTLGIGEIVYPDSIEKEINRIYYSDNGQYFLFDDYSQSFINIIGNVKHQ